MPRTSFSMSALALAAAAVASAANAGTINVSQIGGGLLLNSGPGPVTGVAPAFLPTTLAALHASMNASGVNTDGKITFAAIDTGTAGLAMIALVDRITALPGAPSAATVHFDGTSASTTSGFTTDAGIFIIPSPPTNIATGDFNWNSNGDGDAFAWGNLVGGNTMTWRFQRNGVLGLDDPSTFQFVTWTGTAWSLITVPSSQTSFSANGEYGFSANVAVPAPAAASLLAAAGLGLRRRRR